MNHSYVYILAISFLLYLSPAGEFGLSQLLKTQESEINSASNNASFHENPTHYTVDEFVMGADLSYVNQILDHQGVYRDSGVVENPYQIFREYGTNVVRLRLWHTPDWVQQKVYPDQDVPLYSGLKDVERSTRQAKQQGMAVNLDFHYSDIWADPGTQEIPEAWRQISSIEVLEDSVYSYTRFTLEYLAGRNLLPEMVQIGNETNCGMIYSEAPSGFPNLNVCEGDNWEKLGRIVNSAIQAVRDLSHQENYPIKIILHIAQPENVASWFDELTSKGAVSDFDIVGFSYYSNWSEVPLHKVSEYVAQFREAYGKQVMIMETAYSWTIQNADSYHNILGKNSLEEGYSATPKGQRSYMRTLTREVIEGGGGGLFYWEPAWISSNMQDLWGTGSSWENNTFFDDEGNLHQGIYYMTEEYELE